MRPDADVRSRGKQQDLYGAYQRGTPSSEGDESFKRLALSNNPAGAALGQQNTANVLSRG